MKTKLTLCFFCLLSLLLSLLFAGWTAENIFFDKLFYKKSIIHGYWPEGKQITLDMFGARARDMATLFNLKDAYSGNAESGGRAVLGAHDQKKVYTIVVIGDSYVWGEGIKNEARFVKILEDSLNGVRPTRVISLGNSGDNIIENYLKYKISFRVFSDADLYIFTLVNNDLLFNQRFQYYDSEAGNELIKNCGVPVLELLPGETRLSRQIFTERIAEATKETSFNWCVFQKILPLLPSRNAMYFTPDVFLYPTWDEVNKTIREYERVGLTVFPTRESSVDNIKIDTRMYVSRRETHPSAYANKMFAEILFEEITNNPKWGFVKGEK